LIALAAFGAFRQSCAQDPDSLARYALAVVRIMIAGLYSLLPRGEKFKRLMNKCGISFTRVGIVTETSNVNILQADGAQYNLQLSGFNHFR
jgi:hypothetical protein